jgi:hypothetical protein
MPPAETWIAVLERHVAEAQRRVERQKALLEKLQAKYTGRIVTQAQSVLTILEHSLRLAEGHARRERAKIGCRSTAKGPKSVAPN